MGDFVMCDERRGGRGSVMRERGRERWIDLGEGQRMDRKEDLKWKCHVGIDYVLCYYCMYVPYIYIYIYTTIGK